ncbi:PREDICTED: multidrug resistance-associated protein 1-like, partial [Rhagoletis zephyria]|uniref:multidrug resistance-associated protein 1-like n=1 Tax=Rhagoletis zephyria TaxID=28612 RepID=UPI0008115141
VPKGSLVAIVGQVGSGKSSLLSAMLGDMEKVGGSVNVARGSSIAYVAQQAWIRNATLRDNVLFGSALQSARYQRVIEMCALKPDLAILPGGDQVEIGEKGINLSGGQKQRVAIARACYDTADVVLLDDPLSAVDSHVAKHLFAHVLSSKTGFLKDRTRVLATNNISILPEVDRIVVLSTSGTISEVGSYRELMANSGKFAEFVREHNSEDLNKKEAEEEREREKALREKFARSTSVISTASSTASSVHKRKLTINGTLRSLDGFDGDSAMVELGEADSSSASKKLIQTELAETGGYITYFKSYTWTWCAIILLGFVAKQLAAVGSNVWLAVWSNDKLHGGNGTEQNDEDLALRNVRLGVYAALGVTQGICVAVGSISLAIATIKSSVTFHRRLFDRIMRSPMRFFDTTPLGRIVNRFSKDIDTVDTAIPYSIEGLVFCLLEVVATIIYIAVQVPVFLAAVLPTLILYYFIQKFYLATSRQLKRLESITRSPIYSHFGETLSGVATIRAYGLGDSFTGQSNAHVDTNQRCYYPNFIANRWLALRLEFCGNLIIIFAAIFAVIYRESFQERPGFVGLIITYSFTVTLNLNWMVRMTSEMETNVVSVERISEYCQLEVEREWRRPENRDPVLPVGWPREGEISFVDYSVRYREGLDLVLSDVSVDIGAGEKIGIVGRTGSGKSTLTLALFRILEAAFGCIKIDGVEVGRLGLHELRGILSIIPQDPVLFSGTIRSNLDPFSVYSDAQLWEALGHAHLAEYIRSLDAGLEYVVAENGENLSIGQRQLICLARALLRRTKILVLDEATAAIDLETDALIQETIRREFAHCTVLTIAHRLNTILDSTRVLVMDAGRVLEFDTPEALLANTDSSFYSLAKDAGLV